MCAVLVGCSLCALLLTLLTYLFMHLAREEAFMHRRVCWLFLVALWLILHARVDAAYISIHACI